MKLPRTFEQIRAFFFQVIEQPILTSFLVLLGMCVIILGASMPYYITDFEGFYMQLLVEAHGILFDISIFGILIFWLNKRGEQRLRIRTYKDEIDDFRLWKSEEAAFRTVGNIKRLNSHKITDINLVNCYLSKTNLNYVNLAGSNINSADLTNSSLVETNLFNCRLNQTNLECSTLNQANMEGAYASGASFKDAYLIKTYLQGSYLIKSNFFGAFLMEANLNGAYVTGADFTNANLYKADLRNAVGLTIEQLQSAKTLYLAQLDPELEEEVKQKLPDLIGK